MVSGRLGDILESADVVLCCGAGGVGKTTTAAAVGLVAAEQFERRVLVMTVDPARRLADALGLHELDDKPVEVNVRGGGSRQGSPGRLDALMLDPAASWKRLIAQLAPDSETAERLLSNRVYQAVTQQFVQSHDYLAMARLHDLRTTGEHDLVIVDTPPSRHALDFLDAPQRMLEFFDSRLLHWMTNGSRGPANAAAAMFQRVANRVLGGGFVADIGEFFALLQMLSVGFVEASLAVSQVLSAPSTATLVVTTPEGGPIRESKAFAGELAARSMRLDGLVVNRAVPRRLLRPDVEKLAASWSADASGPPDGAGVRQMRGAAASVYFRTVGANQAAEPVLDELVQQARWAATVERFDGPLNDLDGLRSFGLALSGGLD
ncbi:MAG: ArsA family ATPase [Acidimicrobiales bacterium]|jgi:anion-transporting  ArsA/GET3 family ATPase